MSKGSNREFIFGNTLNIVGIVIPLIAITAFSIIGLMIDTEQYRLPYLSVLCALIFGSCLSTAIKSYDLTSNMKRFIGAEDRITDGLNKITKATAIINNFVDDEDLDAIRIYTEWLSENRQLSREVPPLSSYCEWQKVELKKKLLGMTRDCRDQALLIDSAVKELSSNKALLVAVPSKSVIAISFEDTLFWKSAEGISFLKAHQDVLSKNISITRVFIVKDSEQVELSAIIKEQKELGIKVLSVQHELVKHLEPEDVVIYDDKLIRKGYNNVTTKDNMYKQAMLIAAPDVLIAELEKVHGIIDIADEH